MARAAKIQQPETRGYRAIRFIETYCRVPEGKLVGQPIRLIAEQKKFIIDVLDNPHGTRIGILSIARKNAKTALIACILLVFLIGPERRMNARLCSGAMSRKQAAEVYNYASKIIMLSPELSKIARVIPSQKTIVGLTANTEYVAMSAEAKTALGGSPLLAILDEVGQIVGPSDDYIDAITTSQGAHENPLLLYMSTQAATDADYFSIIIDDALESKDPKIVCHLYTAPAGCDLMDESAWRAANPALGIFRSIDDLREQMVQASRMPSKENMARNLLLNQRVSTNSPFISKSTWIDCAEEPLPLSECDEIYGGLDLSSRNDLTALVLLGIHKETNTMNVHCYFWTPSVGLSERAKRDRAPYDLWVKQGFLRETPGAYINYEFVAQEIGEITEGLEIAAIGFDRWRIDILKKEVSDIDLTLPLTPFGQGFKDMSPALDAVEEAILNKQLRHGAHPVLTMCAANAMVTYDPAKNRKLDKTKTSGRIDGMVALAMAAGTAEKEHEDISEGNLDDYLSSPVII